MCALFHLLIQLFIYSLSKLLAHSLIQSLGISQLSGLRLQVGLYFNCFPHQVSKKERTRSGFPQ